MKKIKFVWGLLFICCNLWADELVIHSIPNEIVYTRHNNDFTVQVRLPGKDWKDLFEYNVSVDLDNPQPASMVQFDFSGKVEMKVRVNNGMIHQVNIRPAEKQIIPLIKNNTILFSLDKPVKLSLEVNGDRLHNLHIFANPLETEIPDPKDPDVIYFAPGLHKPKDLPGNAFRVSSGQTVYLAPGAVVRGKFACSHSENIRFLGRGIIEEPERGFELINCKNIEIEGITVINPMHYTVYGGQTDGLKIKNLKSFSCRGWSDGIDLMSCSNVEIDDVFMRNSDDCIAIYGHRWSFYGDVKNYDVKNSILWADVAHPINIGIHGDTKGNGNTIEQLNFSNIDILEHHEDDREFQGCMAFMVGDHNLVKDVVFENIRVESISEGRLFSARVLFNKKYNDAPGSGIENVIFRNIFYNGSDENESLIEGYNDKCKVKNVLFENIVINGKRIKSFEEGNIKIGEYTENVRLN